MTTTDLPLAGKVAYVTGAARGQGRSHCIRLARGRRRRGDRCVRRSPTTTGTRPRPGDLVEDFEPRRTFLTARKIRKISSGKERSADRLHPRLVLDRRVTGAQRPDQRVLGDGRDE